MKQQYILVVAASLLMMIWLPAAFQSNEPIAQDRTPEQKTGASGKSPPTDLREPVTGMEFRWVPGGSFEMGCGARTRECDDNEQPVRTVRLAAFWMGRQEVTQGQWKRVMGTNPSESSYAVHHPANVGDIFPVANVPWKDVQKFIKKLNALTNGTYRLPSEAEWEYACRSGGRPVRFAWGNEEPLCRKGARNGAKFNNSNGCHMTGSEPVGSYSPNAVGLYDMNGNVFEWVQDNITNYDNLGTDNPIHETSGASRVVRGGSHRSEPHDLRCSSRFSNISSLGLNDLGFRLARSK